MAILFGTDGWRAIIAEDFTFANLELVARAAAQFYRKHPNAGNGIVVGGDARFLSSRFAATVARVFAAEGMAVWLADGIASTPQISLAAKQKKLSGGVIITASHNPAEYNGFKLKADYGGPSAPEDIAKVQASVTKLETARDAGSLRRRALPELADLVKARKVKRFDAKARYVEYVKKKIDLDLIARANFRVLYDPMHGSGINTMDQLLPNVDQLHNSFNPAFGDLDHPEPLGEYLPGLINGMRSGNYSIGMATDGDADRLGMVDEEGNFIDSHRVFVLLMKYLYEDRRLKGSVAKTISLTTMINTYCSRHGITMHETPVGFKYIARLMTTEKVVIGGEESGGLGTALHIPERDGIFNGLLVLEMMAHRGKTLGQLSRELDDEFGPHRYSRRDVRMSVAQKNAILKSAQRGISKLGPYPVTATSTLDGFKFFVENGWLLIRASGTEPLLRYYAEADSEEKVGRLLDAGLKLA
ncbi:MAG: phosphoglucomutase/phosphomannomutase family protein [Bacteroidetes bacterium]|nr:phosphoglucomutase/phosphomannomutase family protein [Bacteroidota bacterium]